jgi:Ras-related protein Rab-5C
VGKTSILQVLLHDSFNDKMANTLGACFHSYESEDSKGEAIKMDIWDTAGQERFRSLLTLYYKNSDAVVIVFDVNDANSFKTVDYWARQIETNC